MEPRIPSWLAQIVSLVLMLVGFGPMAAGVLYQVISGGPPNFAFYLPYASAFVAGLVVLFWDRQRQPSEPHSTGTASRVLYSRMTLAFLGLLVVALAVAVVWSTELQGSIVWYLLSVFVTAGLWGSLFSGWGCYKAGGRLRA